MLLRYRCPACHKLLSRLRFEAGHRQQTCMQVPLVPMCCGALLQPAAFLSKHLPASMDSLVVPEYVTQVSRTRPC